MAEHHSSRAFQVLSGTRNSKTLYAAAIVVPHSHSLVSLHLPNLNSGLGGDGEKDWAEGEGLNLSMLATAKGETSGVEAEAAVRNPRARSRFPCSSNFFIPRNGKSLSFSYLSIPAERGGGMGDGLPLKGECWGNKSVEVEAEADCMS